MVHKLKIDHDAFEALNSSIKRFELRYNDRNYQVGDILQLQETVYTAAEMKAGKPLEFVPGKECIFTIRYILRGPCYGLEEGWVILS